MRPWRRCVSFRGIILTLLFLPVAAPAMGEGPRGAAQGIAAYLPDQGVVYDGSTSAASTLFFAFSKDGYLVDVGEGDDPCPASGHDPMSGLYVWGPAVQGVTSPDETLAEGPSFMRMGEVPTLPADLFDLGDACDVLAAFPAVNAYLDFIQDEAQGILDDAGAVLEAARTVLCDTLDIIDAADPAPLSSPCDRVGCFSTFTMDPVVAPAEPSGSGGGSFGCPHSHVSDLRLIPDLLDFLRYHATRADDAYLALLSHQENVQNCVDESGYVGKECPVVAAWTEYGEIQSAVAHVQEMFERISGLVEEFTLEELESCCESSGLQEDAPLSPSGAVGISFSRQALGRFVGALEKAAHSPTYPPEPGRAASFLDLAARLSEVEGDRVLQVIFRSNSEVGQHVVAVRPPVYPPDPGLPEVVILMALRRDAPLPPMNIADSRLLLGAFRTFRDVVRPPRIGPDVPP